MINKEKLYTMTELAEYLMTTRQVVGKHISNGDLKAFKVGREWRVTQSQLSVFMANRGD